MSKRVFSAFVALAMVFSCSAAFAEELLTTTQTAPIDAEVVFTPVVTAELVEVGDQFMVEFHAKGVGEYLAYQIGGKFDHEKAEMVAPVFEADGFSILANDFSNEDGTFCMAAAGLNLVPNTNEVLCSFLFKAKAEGEFTIEFTAEGSYSTMIGRSKIAEDGSYFYDLDIKGFSCNIAAESGNEEVVLIADKEPLSSYNDMYGYSWAEKEIGALEKAGIFEDIAGESFRPGESVTRGDFMLMLVRACSLKQNGEVENFTDVPEDSYYAEAVKIAKSLGIATGTEHNTFLPDTTITRQDICALVHRTLVYLNKVRAMEDPDEYIGEYADKDSISEYALKDVAAMLRAKIIQGDTNEDGEKVIRPLSETTRAEAAIIINRVMIFNILISQ
ncbi:MAG: S-layer homology domain-containing protein [Clostridia bacterium]|nr:S-layer homology domain-containing protein [Clostridia bacterium]